jgi:DNA-binding NtrC family response regulator
MTLIPLLTKSTERSAGRGTGMEDVFRQIDRAACSNAAVLITGETGTGKERVARAIHARSLRRSHPFVKVFCAAVPDGLLEPDLFGTKKGAQAGSVCGQLGKLELSNNGTLYLDHMEEMPLWFRTRLLEGLRKGIFSRIGGNTDHELNVRVISAANTSRGEATEEEGYEMVIALAPLRERREHIPFLVNFFLDKFNARYNRRLPRLSQRFMNRLTAYDWPGNIRELEALIKQIVVSEDETAIWDEWVASSAGRKKSSA